MLKTFFGGVHPKENKSSTAPKNIKILAVPQRLVVPLGQHIGAICTPVVAVGEKVKKGQLLGTQNAMVSAFVHSPTSGTVSSIAQMPHPVAGKCLAVEIEADGEDAWTRGVPQKRDWQELSVDKIIHIVHNAGIVGLGGACFPTHVKLSPPADAKIEHLVINAAECEPYLTADHRVLLERTSDFFTGIRVLQKVLGQPKVVIGIEENKQDAIVLLKKVIAEQEYTDMSIVVLKCKYPQGAEKMLIHAVCNRQVAQGALPSSVGVVVQNVGTAVAVTDAVVHNIPLIERVVTVSGGCIAQPQNILVRIGTLFKDVLESCGLTEQPAKIIIGGPMMGAAQASIEVPVIKGTSGILALSSKEIAVTKERPCIRCGNCVRSCPMRLNPSMLSILGEREHYKTAKEEYNLFDCMECGVCEYICPAKRNIVQYIKLSKKLSG